MSKLVLVDKKATRVPYSDSEVDFFALLNGITGQWNILPKSEVIGTSSVNLNKQTNYVDAWEQLMK